MTKERGLDKVFFGLLQELLRFTFTSFLSTTAWLIGTSVSVRPYCLLMLDSSTGKKSSLQQLNSDSGARYDFRLGLPYLKPQILLYE
jgi:hypothetical protein